MRAYSAHFRLQQEMKATENHHENFYVCRREEGREDRHSVRQKHFKGRLDPHVQLLSEGKCSVSVWQTSYWKTFVGTCREETDQDCWGNIQILNGAAQCFKAGGITSFKAIRIQYSNNLPSETDRRLSDRAIGCKRIPSSSTAVSTSRAEIIPARFFFYIPPLRLPLPVKEKHRLLFGYSRAAIQKIQHARRK